ncbi:hypothetical protein CHS0354_006006 [Potamilus streckersoni]|uniref:Uncharacterized protein n=1 Tax=Potamilus streckersoni TaxID=2493646 RepID=A0AAE0RP88_9BIVA|nr:hypothetical protein CHS0354_006006 [Potamilus streckersoni]
MEDSSPLFPNSSVKGLRCSDMKNSNPLFPDMEDSSPWCSDIINSSHLFPDVDDSSPKNLDINNSSPLFLDVEGNSPRIRILTIAVLCFLMWKIAVDGELHVEDISRRGRASCGI